LLAPVHRLFNHRGLRRAFLWARVPLGILVAAALIYRARPDWLWAGFALSMLGEIVQLWAFAALDKNASLACNGPYAVVRNPMYLGRYFIILGAVMLLGSVWAIALYTLVYYFYVVNRVAREESRLRPALGKPYDDYCAHVSRFLPGVPIPGSRVLYWDPRLFRRNHGWSNLAGTLGFWTVAVLALAEWP
jgi:protein-S-isoprenylcysteine O-methyltransferase Ste14